jgi:hypothetical protein
VPFDIEKASTLLAEPDEALGAIHALWPVRGMIFTELGALKTLCGVEAYPIQRAESPGPKVACACSW